MIDGEVEVMDLPTTSDFICLLASHANEDAKDGQWGYYPNARGEVLTKEKADLVPGSEKWIGKRVFDANGLVEEYIKDIKDGSINERIKFQYDVWCYGHIGDNIKELVELPGGAVFKVNANGEFTDVAYLYRKNGDGALDWDIFVCNDVQKGLCIEKLDESYTNWGLISMVMRYDAPGPITKDLPPVKKGVPYGIVQSSVLNFRAGDDRHLVTSLPNGTVVKLTGNIDGDWTECVVGEHTGFVFTKFVEKHFE